MANRVRMLSALPGCVRLSRHVVAVGTDLDAEGRRISPRRAGAGAPPQDRGLTRVRVTLGALCKADVEPATPPPCKPHAAAIGLAFQVQ